MWKQLFYILLVLPIFLSSCKQKQQTSQQTREEHTIKNDSTSNTKIAFKEKTHNFGDLQAGEIVTHTFYFKNTGKTNLVIRNVETSCGCTVPKYDKTPIPPGKEGKIEVEFNSSGRIGKQFKIIHIFANVPEKVLNLKITANIKQ